MPTLGGRRRRGRSLGRHYRIIRPQGPLFYSKTLPLTTSISFEVVQT
ncbi:MAG: hypothetical protein ACTS4V_01245 [Candidatus Hodgkinia cicadicola]